jgi:hypothetical protein
MTSPDQLGDSQDVFDPVARLYKIDPFLLSTEDVFQALNYLDPRSPTALQDAEEVLGFAETGLRLHPDSAAWDYTVERVQKVFDARDRQSTTK